MKLFIHEHKAPAVPQKPSDCRDLSSGAGRIVTSLHIDLFSDDIRSKVGDRVSQPSLCDIMFSLCVFGTKRNVLADLTFCRHP